MVLVVWFQFFGFLLFFFFSSRRRHTRFDCDWSSDVCSSDLSFTGALVSLVLVGGTINLFSQIGLVMLVGLVTKNSILIVEFANQLREQGHDLMSATREASITRFRPILMTAVSTIAGIIPVALGLGAGGEARAPLGIAVAGGMLFSTILTFVVVPATYILFERARVRLLGAPSVVAADPRAAA